MCVSASKSYINHKFSNIEQQINTNFFFFFYILIDILFFAHMKVNVPAMSLPFLFFYLLVSNDKGQIKVTSFQITR